MRPAEAYTIAQSRTPKQNLPKNALQHPVGLGVVEFPEQLRQEGAEVVDHPALADAQSVTVTLGVLPDRYYDVTVLDGDVEGKDRTAGGLPVVFGVQRAEAVLAEEVAGPFVDVDVLVAVLVLALEEGLAVDVGGRLVEVLAGGQLQEVLLVEEHAVVTAPRALVDALEGQLRVEVRDGLPTGVDLHAAGARHGPAWVAAGKRSTGLLADDVDVHGVLAVRVVEVVGHLRTVPKAPSGSPLQLSSTVSVRVSPASKGPDTRAIGA